MSIGAHKKKLIGSESVGSSRESYTVGQALKTYYGYENKGKYMFVFHTHAQGGDASYVVMGDF